MTDSNNKSIAGWLASGEFTPLDEWRHELELGDR